jgi:hypothetical protein
MATSTAVAAHSTAPAVAVLQALGATLAVVTYRVAAPKRLPFLLLLQPLFTTAHQPKYRLNPTGVP